MKIKTANEFYFSQHSKNSMFVISYTMQVLGWKPGRLGGIRRPFSSPVAITVWIPSGVGCDSLAVSSCLGEHQPGAHSAIPRKQVGMGILKTCRQTVSSRPCLSPLQRERKDQALGFSPLSSSAVSLPSPPRPFLFLLSPTIIICLKYRSYRNFVFQISWNFIDGLISNRSYGHARRMTRKSWITNTFFFLFKLLFGLDF